MSWLCYTLESVLCEVFRFKLKQGIFKLANIILFIYTYLLVYLNFWKFTNKEHYLFLEKVVSAFRNNCFMKSELQK
jgi:hypothetical protein